MVGNPTMEKIRAKVTITSTSQRLKNWLRERNVIKRPISVLSCEKEEQGKMMV